MEHLGDICIRHTVHMYVKGVTLHFATKVTVRCAKECEIRTHSMASCQRVSIEPIVERHVIFSACVTQQVKFILEKYQLFPKIKQFQYYCLN